MALGPVRTKMLETIRVLLSSEETHLGLRFQGVDMGYAYTKSALMGERDGGPPTLQVRRTCRRIMVGQHMESNNGVASSREGERAACTQKWQLEGLLS